MKKFTLYLNAVPSNAELPPERIRCNDIILPFDFNPHSVRLWVIGNEYGALGAVWASHEQDAIDALIDNGLAEGILISEKEVAEEDKGNVARGGNAGEAYETEHLWINQVTMEPVRDLALLLKFAEARGAGMETLDF